MKKPKRRLGRALSDMGVQALLSDAQADLQPNEQIKHIDLAKISPNKNQPRKTFKPEPLSELAESVKSHGVLQPIIVTPKAEGYEIIAGERRYRACIQAGLNTIPTIIKNLDELAAESIAIIENIQREALNPIDQAFAYARLIDNHQLSHDDVAKKVNKSRSAISNSLRLIKLHPEAKQALKDGLIDMGHGRTLLGAPYEKQPQLTLTIIKRQLSVRQVEQLIKQLNQPKPQRSPKDNHWIANTLKQLNLKARIRGSHEKGAITLQYDSPESLEKILSALTSQQHLQNKESA
ncbi:ParB/RepB/Spo0J family partition protein [Candidatus Synchoanobacter obligatus]|uniref:ParB/RepB/Spo0J family partition protein n=1 Tax=Candidatus Synchoanobacter obligatus TaxID=2919597 RepID=A0ABT1L5W8_9GAMM|nr:ParB/RepB/Spo0J family partition protein [Candidatus Synchoanobacter obligatus]MCP8352263.1 ParB/RepB/Spo0J family partition protein [Candidatus Synchoanobacter obligatus]